MRPHAWRIAALTGAALALAGCAGGPGRLAPSDVSPSPTTSVMADARAKLPASIQDAGVLIFATDAVTPPSTYTNTDGQIIGWEIELAQRVAERLGVRASFAQTPFDQILTNVSEGRVQVGVSSIFDTPEREQLVDMVTYFVGGTLWVGPSASTLTPNTACGATVGGLPGTYQVKVDLPARSDECVRLGRKPITIVKVRDFGQAETDMQLGRLDAVIGDTPVMDSLVQRSRGTLQRLGPSYGSFPYGLAIRKGDDGLAEALIAALESLKADGTYDRLLAKWGVEDGAINVFGTNAASGG